MPFKVVLRFVPFRRTVKQYGMKEEKIIFKPLAGIEPHIFGLLVRRVNHYTTRTNRAGNAPIGPVNAMYEVTAGIPWHYFL